MRVKPSQLLSFQGPPLMNHVEARGLQLAPDIEDIDMLRMLQKAARIVLQLLQMAVLYMDQWRGRLEG